MSDTTRRTGSCLCGGVHFVVTGQPIRVGLCHCKDCRKASGSVYSAFAIWPRDAFETSGAVPHEVLPVAKEDAARARGRDVEGSKDSGIRLREGVRLVG